MSESERLSMEDSEVKISDRFLLLSCLCALVLLITLGFGLELRVKDDLVTEEVLEVDNERDTISLELVVGFKQVSLLFTEGCRTLRRRCVCVFVCVSV